MLADREYMYEPRGTVATRDFDTCIHEAGHAVIADACGFSVSKVTVDTAGSVLGVAGYCSYTRDVNSSVVATNERTVAASGLAANLVYDRKNGIEGRTQDHVQSAASDDPQAQALDTAIRCIENRWDEVVILAEWLREEGTVYHPFNRSQGKWTGWWKVALFFIALIWAVVTAHSSAATTVPPGCESNALYYNQLRGEGCLVLHSDNLGCCSP